MNNCRECAVLRSATDGAGERGDNAGFGGIELIALDLDGTALNPDGVVEQSTIEELEAHRKRGAKIVVATGRSPRGAAVPVEKIRPDACILCGGAHIELCGETYADFRMDTDLVWDIIERYQAKGCRQFVLTLPHISYVSEKLSFADGSFHVRSFEQRFDADVIELSCNFADEDLERAVLEMDPTFEMTKFSVERWRRFAHRDANKGAALELVMRKLGVQSERAVAFGDDYNDISMFGKVGISVAMGNAADEVKLHARYRCGANNEHGIAEFLRVLRENTRKM